MTPITDRDPLLDALADELDKPAVNEQALIQGGITRGRRAQRRRSTVRGGVLLTTAVATVALAAGLNQPAATIQVAASPTPSAPGTASTTPLPGSSPSTEYRQVTIPATAGELTILRSHLPGSQIRYTNQQIDAVLMEVTDGKGTSWAGAGMGHNRWHSMASPSSTCSTANGCVARKLGTAELWTTSDEEKAGEGSWTFLRRADGYILWYGQRGNLGGNTVTRPGKLLTPQQIIALLTDPRWDKELHAVPTSSQPVASTPMTSSQPVASTPMTSSQPVASTPPPSTAGTPR